MPRLRANMRVPGLTNVVCALYNPNETLAVGAVAATESVLEPGTYVADVDYDPAAFVGLAMWSSASVAGVAVEELSPVGAIDLTQTVDGVALSVILTELLALASGDVSAVANGNGTVTLTFKRRNGTTTAFTTTYDPATGARS